MERGVGCRASLVEGLDLNVIGSAGSAGGDGDKAGGCGGGIASVTDRGGVGALAYVSLEHDVVGARRGLRGGHGVASAVTHHAAGGGYDGKIVLPLQVADLRSEVCDRIH